MKVLFCALVIFYMSVANAQGINSYKVEKANSDHSRIILSGGVNDVEIGTVLEHNDEFGETCRGEVVKVSQATFVADISRCKSPQKVKVGESMSLVEEKAPTGVVVPEFSEKSGDDVELPSRNESWYALWGFGFSGVSYEDPTEAAVNELEAAPGVHRLTINIDIFGFYWPTSNHKSMYGLVVNSVTDRFVGPGGTLTFLQYTLGFSFYSFFGQNVGDGWFLRGDVGPAWYRVEVDTTGLKHEESSDIGVGVLGGGGYSFVIGDETRMPLGFYVTHRAAEGESAVSANLTLSLLF